MNSEKVLEIFKKTGALLEGHFELRSKLHSNRYFQCAIVLSHPRIAADLCAELAGKMKNVVAGAGEIDAVIAPAMGGLIVGHELARSLNLKFIFVEKQDNVLVMRRVGIRKGGKYVIAEDVVTRGGRVQETIDIVEKGGGSVVAIGMIVDRSGGKTKFAPPTFSILEMEPVTYEPANCPLCAQKLPLVHPGS
jgi:orotate phosphoribosyltransferase